MNIRFRTSLFLMFCAQLLVTNTVSVRAMQPSKNTPVLGSVGYCVPVVDETNPASIASCGTDKYKKIKAMLDAGYGLDINKPEETRRLYIALEAVSSPCHPLNREENLAIAEMLVAHPRINLNDTSYSSHKRSALHMACLDKGSQKILLLLLNHGATSWDIPYDIVGSPTPLQMAEAHGITVLKEWVEKKKQEKK